MTTPPPYPYPVAPPMSPEDEKTWATLVHIGGIILHWVAPLVGYLVLKDRGPFIRENTRRALNFQISIVIYYVAGAVLSIILIGVLVILAAAILNVVFSIIAAVRAGQGYTFDYPLSITFVK